jgi:sugar phosphate isomerase/epimerase
VRLRHVDGSVLHVAYCTNVHPADDLDGIAAQLERYAAPVRAILDVPVLGVGLWVAAPALDHPDAAARLAKQLDHLGLEVVTLNGFPYTAFHAPVVKRDVYWPNWAQDERRHYTLGLARLLAGLLPDDVAEGSISTLPLGWREGWDEQAHAAALGNLERLAADLSALEAETGKRIRLALEPEPGCTVETIAQACDVLSGLAPDWVGVCLDACHLAVQFEQPHDAVAQLRAAAVPIVKTQVSNALRVPRPGTSEGRDLLARFDEPRFLHQVRTRVDDRVEGGDDLPTALAGGLSDAGEWRVHYHVPVTSAEHTSQAELSATLASLAGNETPLTRHFEVETYTWTVMRDAPRDDDSLVAALAAELAWTRDQLIALGAEDLQ